MLIDLHCHTFPLSQCSALKPEELVDLARERGLDGICLTEHDALWAADALDNLRRRTAFPIFSGVEVTTDGGHLLVFGLASLPAGAAAADTLIATAHSAGGLVYAGHPARDMAMRGRMPEGLDSVEAVNGSDSRLQNAAAAGLAAKYALPGIGGSDAHTRDEVARAATEFEATTRTQPELLEALRAGRYRAVYA